MTSTRKSVIFSTLANFGAIATSLILVVVVARWLFPAEIGAFAVAYAIVSLLEPLRQAQIVPYVIQAKEIDRGTLRGVSFVGWVTTAVIFAVAVCIALLMIGPFDVPEAGQLLLIMCGGFIAMTIAQPAFSILNREMRFGLISTIEISGALTKAAVTIAGLYAGLRAEALALGILGEFLVKLAYVFCVDRAQAFAFPSRSNTGPIWNFCLKFTGAQFVIRSGAAVSDLLVGSFLGFAAAGLFNRSSVLVRKMRSGIEKATMPVAMAVFAASSRKGLGYARDDYLTGVTMLTGVTWSALAVIIALAEPMVLTTFGERWEATIPLVQVLAGAAIVHGTTAMVPSLMASIGRVDSLLRRNLLIQVPRLAILFVCVQFSLTAVVWGLFAAMLIHFAVNQALLAREVEIGFGTMAQTLWRSFAVAVMSAVAAYLSLQIPGISTTPYLVQLVAGLMGAGIAWFSVLFLLRHPLRGELLGAVGKVRSWLGDRS